METDQTNQQATRIFAKRDLNRPKDGTFGFETEKDQPVGPGNAEKIKSFRELLVWQKGLALVKAIYETTGSFPREEVYGLSSQMRRSAVSVPSNIAEGFRRRFSKEFKQFLNIAIGALAEVETQIIIATELGYLKIEKRQQLDALTDQVARLAVGLSKKL